MIALDVYEIIGSMTGLSGAVLVATYSKYSRYGWICTPSLVPVPTLQRGGTGNSYRMGVLTGAVISKVYPIFRILPNWALP